MATWKDVEALIGRAKGAVVRANFGGQLLRIPKLGVCSMEEFGKNPKRFAAMPVKDAALLLQCTDRHVKALRRKYKQGKFL